jgi:hypothetical protein
MSKLNSVDVFKNGSVSICEDLEDKPNHRRTLCPGDDISTEPQEVQDACNEAWTPEVVQAYREHLESIV